MRSRAHYGGAAVTESIMILEPILGFRFEYISRSLNSEAHALSFHSPSSLISSHFIWRSETEGGVDSVSKLWDCLIFGYAGDYWKHHHQGGGVIQMLVIDDPPPSDLPSSTTTTTTSCCFANTNNLQIFSIRDYVFNSRHKDIQTNWPFSNKHLHRLLKHDINHLLPPFQPAHHLTPSFNNNAISGIQEADQTQTQTQTPFVAEEEEEENQSLLKKLVTADEYHALQGEAVVQILELDPHPHPCEPQKKRKKEETNTMSDPMGSKICPVCKTFNSTSNTTLNAHIDQCLSSDASQSKLTKHRVKIRKMRSMVDIYASAIRCTLEELDTRNGSTWAHVDSNLPTTQIKQQRLTPVDIEDNNGAVYFDSNGTKLRIISNFCQGSTSTIGETSSKAILKDRPEEGIIFSPDRRKTLSTRLKHTPQKKKLCLLEPADRSQITEMPERRNVIDKNLDKEASLSDHQKAHSEINQSDSGTVRQWVCSKGTENLNKFNGTDPKRDVGNPLHMAGDPLRERIQPNIGTSSIEGSHVLKFPSSSRSSISSLKNKKMERPKYGERVAQNRTKTRMPPGGCMSKLPTSSGKFVSSPKRKRVEVCPAPAKISDGSQKADTNKRESCNPFLRNAKELSSIRSGSIVGPSFPNSKSYETNEHSVLKKPRLRRSLAEIDEQVGAHPQEKGTSTTSGREEFVGVERQMSEPGLCTLNSAATLDFHFDTLSEAFVSEIQKPACSSEIQSNSLPSIENLTRPIDGKEALVPITDQSLYENQLAYGTNEVINQDADKALEKVCRVEDPRLSSPEVQSTGYGADIAPGALGSFLLNYGEMSSGEFRANSTLTSSQIHSSQDPHLMVDRDSSRSPVSTTSAIFHPPPARTDKCLRLESSSEPLVQSCLSWKEGAYPCPSTIYRESQFLRQQSMGSYYPSIGPDSPSSIQTSRNSEIASPFFESPRRPVSADPSSIYSEQRLPRLGDLTYDELSSQVRPPSTSNLVIRLMGKNLVVANNNNDIPAQLKLSSSVVQNDFTKLKYSTHLVCSTGNAPNSDCGSFYPTSAVAYNQQPQAPPGNSGGFRGPFLRHELNGEPTPNTLTCYVDRVIADPHTQHFNPYLLREAICTADSSRNEANSRIMNSNSYPEAAFSQPSPFLTSEPTEGPNHSFLVPSPGPGVANASSARQAGNSEGSAGAASRNPFMCAFPSTGHLSRGKCYPAGYI
ncbi:hypothetical protein GIB67_033333 [Kingdonia uniflora]|uniref:UBZ4-type domain-containing protein n=1 Tax=Kingdonia uniflora TaxID=39325 RepID=A0A7J7LTV7_9MAGN|nr:hypothetical protein GIB67_033333 [Kingdonia uniflora]